MRGGVRRCSMTGQTSCHWPRLPNQPVARAVAIRLSWIRIAPGQAVTGLAALRQPAERAKPATSAVLLGHAAARTAGTRGAAARGADARAAARTVAVRG